MLKQLLYLVEHRLIAHLTKPHAEFAAIVHRALPRRVAPDAILAPARWQLPPIDGERLEIVVHVGHLY